MNEGQNARKRAQTRERLQMCEAQESAARAEARERVRAAQERERQERQQRATASRRRSEDKAMALRRASSHSTTVQSNAPARPAAHAAPIDTMEESAMSEQDLIELFNHPLGEEEMRRARQALAADAAWSCLLDEDHADRLTCTLVHQASGTRVHVAQERSLVGIWNSRI